MTIRIIIKLIDNFDVLIILKLCVLSNTFFNHRLICRSNKATLSSNSMRSMSLVLVAFEIWMTVSHPSDTCTILSDKAILSMTVFAATAPFLVLRWHTLIISVHLECLFQQSSLFITGNQAFNRSPYESHLSNKLHKVHLFKQAVSCRLKVSVTFTLSQTVDEAAVWKQTVQVFFQGWLLLSV